MLINDKKTPSFVKKPIKGGIPATENIATLKLKASPGFDFCNKAIFPNSLLNLSK